MSEIREVIKMKKKFEVNSNNDNRVGEGKWMKDKKEGWQWWNDDKLKVMMIRRRWVVNNNDDNNNEWMSEGKWMREKERKGGW